MKNFTMYSGDSKDIRIDVTDADGEPANLATPVAVRWQLARSATQEPLISKSLEDGEITMDGASSFIVTLAPEDTIELSGKYYHEAEVILIGGIVATVVSGTARVLPALIPPEE